MAAIVDLDISRGSVAASDALSSAVCAMGVFDGVHLGHRYLIDASIQHARANGRKAVIVTFDIDPDELFLGSAAKKLMSNEARIETLSDFDADALAVLKFDAELASMEPERFLDSIFSQSAPRAIFAGEDFRFGKDAHGSLQDIGIWATEHGASGLEVCAIGLQELGGQPITSTRIRNLLADGSLDEALELLGHPYVIGGPIVHGRGQGTGFGVSTADLSVPEELMVAADGVYAAYATLGDSEMRHIAAVSVGIPPTFEDVAKANVEAHLLDFEGDIYGEKLMLDLRYRLRPMKKFDSVDDLLGAIRADIDETRALLS